MIGIGSTYETGLISPRSVSKSSRPGVFGRLLSVYVRRGLESDQHIARLGQSSGDVAVQIEGAGDGDVRPDDTADLFDQHRFARPDSFGEHRPVKLKEHSVNGHVFLQRFYYPRDRLAAGAVLEQFPRRRARRPRRARSLVPYLPRPSFRQFGTALAENI